MATNSSKLDLLAVVDSGDLRVNLKQMAQTSPLFGQVQTVFAQEEVLTGLSAGHVPDILVLASTMPKEEVWQFVRSVKDTPRGQDIACVLIVKKTEEDQVDLAQHLDNGIHGFLFAPFAADDFYEVAKIAAQVKAEAEYFYARLAIHEQVKKLAALIDAFALVRAGGYPEEDVKAHFKKRTEFLKRTTPSQRHVYPEVLGKCCDERPPTPARYDGPSERVRQRLLARALKEIEE